MGKAARKKAENRKSMGLTSPTPSRVPNEYLPTGDKVIPCFGYVYTVHFQDFSPCVFTSHVDDIMTGNQLATFEMVNLGLVTIFFPVLKDYLAFKESIQEKKKSNSPYISFIAKPDYSLKYTDYNKLSVLPFVFNSCLEVPLPKTNLRSFYSGGTLEKEYKEIVVNDPSGIESPVRFVVANTEKGTNELIDAFKKGLLQDEN
jgi:hypothetical protein